MKRIAIALLATAPFLLPATPAAAQATLALTVGANRASVGVDRDGDAFNTLSITRQSIGLAASIPVWAKLGLQLDASYTGKGYTERYNSRPVSRSTLKLAYLEARVMGKVQLLDSGSGAKFHLLLGPAVATETSCQQHVEAVVSDETVNSRVPCPPGSTSSLDFGLAVGAWMEMWVSDSFGLLLSGFHSRGIQDIDAASERVTMKNRGTSLHTGVLISVG